MYNNCRYVYMRGQCMFEDLGYNLRSQYVYVYVQEGTALSTVEREIQIFLTNYDFS